MGRLISSENGVTKTFHYDEGTGQSIIETSKDLGPLLESNKQRFNASDGKFGEFQHIAELDGDCVEAYAKAKGMVKGVDFDNVFSLLSDRKFLKTYLNDPENRYFRTHPGKI